MLVPLALIESISNALDCRLLSFTNRNPRPASRKSLVMRNRTRNGVFFDKGHYEHPVNAQDNLSHKVSFAPDPRFVYDNAKRDAQ